MYNLRIVGHSDEDPASLLANPQNYRIHGYRQQDVLHGILKDVGFVQSVIVNDVTGHIIDGHLRVHMALKNNVSLVPVTHVELSEEEEKKILASFDPIGSLAKIDTEKFQDLINDMEKFDNSIKDLLISDTAHLPKQHSSDIDFDGQKKYIVLVEVYSRDDYNALKDELSERGYTIKGNRNGER